MNSFYHHATFSGKNLLHRKNCATEPQYKKFRPIAFLLNVPVSYLLYHFSCLMSHVHCPVLWSLYIFTQLQLVNFFFCISALVGIAKMAAPARAPALSPQFVAEKVLKNFTYQSTGACFMQRKV